MGNLRRSNSENEKGETVNLGVIVLGSNPNSNAFYIKPFVIRIYIFFLTVFFLVVLPNHSLLTELPLYKAAD